MKPRTHLTKLQQFAFVTLAAITLIGAGFNAYDQYTAAAAATTPLPQAAQKAINRGKLAAGQSHFRAAAPNDSTIYYFLGLADAKIPGRELRAIHWLEAYLATKPNIPQQTRAAIQHEVSALKAANTTTALTPLPHAAMDAITKGKLAAGQGHFRAAAHYFQQALRAAPADPIIYYYLGLTESKIPGRELRAICWFEAYLAADPNVPKQARAALQRKVDALKVMNQVAITHLLNALKNAAIQMAGHSRNDELAKIAALWAREGDTTSALTTASLITDTSEKISALVGIAGAEAENGRAAASRMAFHRAVKDAEAESESQHEDNDLCVIAEEEAKAGDPVDARKAFHQAVTIAAAYPLIWTRDVHLCLVAQDQERSGEFKSAIQTAGLITKDAMEKSIALRKIAEAQAKAGDFKSAIRTADMIAP